MSPPVPCIYFLYWLLKYLQELQSLIPPQWCQIVLRKIKIEYRFNFTSSFNLFTPEPPITACAHPPPFYNLWCHQFWQSQTHYLGRGKRSFSHSMKKIQKKKHVKWTRTLKWESCSTIYTHLHLLPSCPMILKILQFSQKQFQQKKDLSKYPARKHECKNQLKEQGEEQEKGKS